MTILNNLLNYKLSKVESTSDIQFGTYYTYNDLSSQRFKVVVDINEITVYKANYKPCQTCPEYEKLFKLTKFIKYWAGFDPSIYKQHGNSILIHQMDNDYMFIGHMIYSFKTDEPIIDFISMYNGDRDIYDREETSRFIS
ncbi:MAG: hypothetical protein Satyrvirus8_24 [Satyrvirus sp.]|uniref:Uncharacterized protein n=1 Tax=Satyrvirus sp. TaxID=2487771 RepID=A0A3G5ADH2_9VIRU|nr:MAG: hypothetical protein Satyrvirus8_24 [Satyrvirus sp.]